MCRWINKDSPESPFPCFALFHWLPSPPPQGANPCEGHRSAIGHHAKCHWSLVFEWTTQTSMLLLFAQQSNVEGLVLLLWKAFCIWVCFSLKQILCKLCFPTLPMNIFINVFMNIFYSLAIFMLTRYNYISNLSLILSSLLFFTFFLFVINTVILYFQIFSSAEPQPVQQPPWSVPPGHLWHPHADGGQPQL